MGSPPQPPEPAPDADSAFYWSGLDRHEILLQRCTACGSIRFPPMPGCTTCGTEEAEIIRAHPGGTIYSWIVVHRSADPAMRDELPYSIAAVDLDDGPRVFGRIDGAERPVIGGRVTATFRSHVGWTELRFRAARRRSGEHS
jgi:uncharacterized OB-fold protein